MSKKAKRTMNTSPSPIDPSVIAGESSRSRGEGRQIESRTWDREMPCLRVSSHWHRHLIGISLLLVARVATPQVIGVGAECHQAEVRDAVARVRAQSPEVEQILKELEDAKHECRVFRKTTGASTVDTNGKHVMIGWPGGSGRYADGSCIEADASLVHEIYHCWVRSKNDGAEPCTFVPTLTVSGVLVHARASCEFDAVRFENRYRKAIGICERLTYDVFNVPGAERTCLAAETACLHPLVVPNAAAPQPASCL